MAPVEETNHTAAARRAAPVLVTGAAGFIGSHLVDRLLADGHRVIGIDDFDPWYDPAAKRANLAGALADPAFTLVETDLTRTSDPGAEPIDDLLDDVSVMFHLAGRPGVQDSWGAGFRPYAERNVLATQQVFDAALSAGVTRVVYASSSSVYGGGSATDGARAAAPISPYGVSKLAGEQLADVYRVRGLAVTSLRYFTVYGPRQRPDMAIHRLFEAAMAGGPAFALRGDGGQRREFTHVDDVVTATMAAAWRAEADGATIDIGGGSSVRLTEVIDRVEHLVGSPVRLRRLAPAAGDPAATTADHEKAERLLDWAPVVDLDTGLASQLTWHRQRRAERSPATGPEPTSPATTSPSPSAPSPRRPAPAVEAELLVAD